MTVSPTATMASASVSKPTTASTGPKTCEWSGHNVSER